MTETTPADANIVAGTLSTGELKIDPVFAEAYPEGAANMADAHYWRSTQLDLLRARPSEPGQRTDSHMPVLTDAPSGAVVPSSDAQWNAFYDDQHRHDPDGAVALIHEWKGDARANLAYAGHAIQSMFTAEDIEDARALGIDTVLAYRWLAGVGRRRAHGGADQPTNAKGQTMQTDTGALNSDEVEKLQAEFYDAHHRGDRIKRDRINARLQAHYDRKYPGEIVGAAVRTA